MHLHVARSHWSRSTVSLHRAPASRCTRPRYRSRSGIAQDHRRPRPRHVRGRRWSAAVAPEARHCRRRRRGATLSSAAAAPLAVASSRQAQRCATACLSHARASSRASPRVCLRWGHWRRWTARRRPVELELEPCSPLLAFRRRYQLRRRRPPRLARCPAVTRWRKAVRGGNAVEHAAAWRRRGAEWPRVQSRCLLMRPRA